MRVADLFDKTKPFPSLEIVPPLGGITKDELLGGIEPLMEFSPRYINVTTHRDEYQYVAQPDGSFSRVVVNSRVSPVAVCASIMSRYSVEVVPHLVCGGQTARDTERLLQDFQFMGIENVMALRGDSVSGEKRFTATPGGYSHASELVSAIKAAGAFCIGVGGYPEKHYEAANLETDIAFLKQKVDAGADYIITQMFFDNAVFFRFVDMCRAAGISVPIIPGLKPLTAKSQVKLLPDAFSIDIPHELTDEIAAAGDDAEAIRRIGVQWCIRQTRELLDRGVPAVHYYTMSKSRNVAEVLRECF
ncbi:MAG: methylenetetrahydrofolate reductase [NAD(P)H] [Bacteroidales bacterium]|nr:methylenetetrahydrofolate reductase [NAD(P)H] [Bacteroidales bacterium]